MNMFWFVIDWCSMSFCTKLRIILWKNLTLKARSPVGLQMSQYLQQLSNSCIIFVKQIFASNGKIAPWLIFTVSEPECVQVFRFQNQITATMFWRLAKVHVIVFFSVCSYVRGFYTSSIVCDPFDDSPKANAVSQTAMWVTYINIDKSCYKEL